MGFFYLFKYKAIVPLIMCLILGSFATLLPILITDYFSLNVIGNIYVLIEFILILFQFKKWGLFKNNLNFYILIFTCFLFWLYSGMYILEIGIRNTYFRAFYSFIIVLGAIDLINKIAFERINLLKDYRFIICIGFIIFYFYNIIIESFCLIKLDFSKQFYYNIFIIKSYLNVFVNLLYFFALLCIPKTMKQKSIM